MTITDGAHATLINGTEHPVKLRKIQETDDHELYEFEPDEAPEPVDQPDPRPASEQRTTPERRPILPAWARSRGELLQASTWAAGHAGHVALFHGVRAPWYAAKVTSLAPRGAARCVNGVWRWASDAEGRPVRGGAVRREDAEEYLKLSRQRNDRVKLRGLIVAAASVFGLLTALTLYLIGGAWLYLGASLAVLALGYAGRPADKPLIGAAVMVPKHQKLTSDLVLRALSALGISGINQAVAKGGSAMVFTAPITRDGPGWRAEGELPLGVDAGDVVDKRTNLASALRRPLGCVWPEGVSEEHPGHLVLWVGDQDLNKAPQKLWPLLASGEVDLFQPQPIGTDQRGRAVTITLMFASMIIGAVPRMGKTFLLRLLLLLAALDARAELHAYNLKGTGDLSPLKPIAHAYRDGEDEEDIEYAVADLRALRQELRRRAKVIRELPKDICPENKVTPDLASNKTLGLHPIVIAVDECQVWFENKEYGAELEEHCTDLVKRGPALGMLIMLATQRPDSKSLPTPISANAILRACLKVMGHTENDMVLGTGAHKAGIKATMFTRSDRGIFWLSGEGNDPQITRGHYVDGPAADLVVERARQLRELAGTLSGYALGMEPKSLAPAYDLLGDILAVVPASEEKVWNERIATRLNELRPEVYGGWKAETVTVALKPFGVTAQDVWSTTDDGKGTTRRGIERARIVHAYEHRKRAK